jgi:hypothetical protein
MYTYTHALVGFSLGGVLSKKLSVRLACALGATMPDWYLLYNVGYNLLASGETVIRDMGMFGYYFSHAAHSCLIWAALITWWNFLSGTGRAARAIFVGMLSHIGVDMLTHSNPGFAASDAGLAWPLKVQLGQIFGMWDYRYGPGILIPKTPEILLCVMLGIYAIFAIREELYPLRKQVPEKSVAAGAAD